MGLKWTDSQDIAIELADKFPRSQSSNRTFYGYAPMDHRA